MSPRGGAFERLIRGVEHVVRAEELKKRLDDGRQLRVKLGVDPTVQDVTLGWAVPLRLLRRFQDEGHTAVLILGDFTARIGDPSGKSETRPQLSKEVVDANAERCLDALKQILSADNLEVRHNSEWLEPMDLPGVLKLTSHYTVAQMLERDDFKQRFEGQRPISIVEFMYPLMQAYDSVAVQADIELGGTDQLFNLLVGRDMQRAHDQAPQIAMTVPLLVGTDGVQKMSQSLGNYISIRDDPEEMFGKTMSIPDDLVVQWGELAAELPEEELGELRSEVEAGGPEAAHAKRRVARAIAAMYHGDDAAAAAEAAFDRQFKEGRAPEEVPEATIPTDAIVDGRVQLPRLLADLGLAASRSDARRLVAQGGVRIDGAVVTDEAVSLESVKGALLQVGKRRWVRITG